MLSVFSLFIPKLTGNEKKVNKESEIGRIGVTKIGRGKRCRGKGEKRNRLLTKTTSFWVTLQTGWVLLLNPRKCSPSAWACNNAHTKKARQPTSGRHTRNEICSNPTMSITTRLRGNQGEHEPRSGQQYTYPREIAHILGKHRALEPWL